ncbi:MAG: hypothetical protein B7Y82_00010 [Sphingomonadales bacterium 32-65-25]|nr:MAG: hypothetical protein B7Y82_00010 [Sphingomonadales bacterium 32-65-25]
MTTPRTRILSVAHGHPDFHKGGGELAAFNLYKAYADHPEVEASFFLGRHDRDQAAAGATGAIWPRRENEYLWDQGIADWFRMRTSNAECLNGGFADLIRRLRPTVVHVHHYVHMGLEFLRVIKTVDPSIGIVMTLHEYIAICFNNGQMVKPGTNALCFRESLEDCHRCFPQRSVEDFWLRKHRYQGYFRLVDQFVAPSDFLARRYIEWGISPAKIVTIENGQTARDPLPPRPLRESGTRNRFGFFGQINPFKGVALLLEGLAGLRKSQRRDILVEIHGSNLEGQAPEFRERIANLRAPLEAEGCLQWIGPYEPFQMAERMAAVDWVVIPSIWWENSPLVIQEAFTFGRPLIGSNIGGMAEKIRHGINGVHVPVGNARAWGETLHHLAGTTDEWERLRAGITPPITHAECAQAHLDLLRQPRSIAA